VAAGAAHAASASAAAAVIAMVARSLVMGCPFRRVGLFGSTRGRWQMCPLFVGVRSR
jgi:hypothetical protein